MVNVPFKAHRCQVELIDRAAAEAEFKRGTANRSAWIREKLISAAREELGEDES